MPGRGEQDCLTSEVSHHIHWSILDADGAHIIVWNGDPDAAHFMTPNRIRNPRGGRPNQAISLTEKDPHVFDLLDELKGQRCTPGYSL